MKKITLKDIAEVTGLSINSVSRALKDKDSISLETRKMVQQVAKDMGYIPNSLASSMRSGGPTALPSSLAKWSTLIMPT